MSDEQLIKNSLLFIYLRDNKSSEERVERVKSCLEEGADVNAADGNDGGNTPLHVAVRRGEPALLDLLLNKGSDVTRTNFNGQTAADIARTLKLDTQILEQLRDAEKTATNTEPRNPNNDMRQNPVQNEVISNDAANEAQEFKYPKRAGTSGVCGQLYETKLLSLVLMRALNDEHIESFLLGTNIRGIGDMDDICLRYRERGRASPVMLFVQAKHREDRNRARLTVDDVRSPAGDYSARKYYEAYLTIMEQFRPDNEDPMFRGEFTDVDCNLVIYTPAKDSFDKKKTDIKVSEKLHYLIDTGENTQVFRYDYDDDDLENLTKMTVIERLKKLGSIFLEMILSEKEKPEVILADKLIATYHVVLGREVLRQSNIQQANKDYRIWEFQPEFFESDDEYLVALQKTFMKEVSTKRCDLSKITNEDRDNLKQAVQDPCANTISNLIGKLATYNEKTKNLQLLQITVFRKKFKTDEFNELVRRLSDIEITENVINEAVQIKLAALKIKLPLSFGNSDMTFRGTDVKVQRRIKAVAEKLTQLMFDANIETKIIDINDNVVGPGKAVEQGFIDINGGIGSAVGNLLVLDENMLKLNLHNETLPNNASMFLRELKEKLNTEELSSYRIKININGFPKDSFHGNEYDKRQARDFLNKLWFYTNQAKEDEVEDILKKDIKLLYNKEEDIFKIQSDAIFLRSHDQVQKWWMKAGEAPYLSRASDFFELAKQAVIDSPLLTVLDFMYRLELQNIGIEFSEDVVSDLELDQSAEAVYNVITDANVFTSIKIKQHFQKQDECTFIDFDYVLSLPLNDYNTMKQELQQIKIKQRNNDTNNNDRTKMQTLIVVYEKLKFYEGFCNKLIEVMQIFNENRIVIVTNDILATDIKNYVGENYRSIRDDKTYLIDLTESSQDKVLEESMIVFQGDEVPVKSVLHGNARNLVRTEILQKLINKEKCEIGHSLIDKIYKEVNYFTERSLSNEDDTYSVDSLDDINDTVVVVSGRPGMGKSALLTHLSLNTKLNDPLPWIVRVNLKHHEKEFIRWQQENLTINIQLVLHFLCMITLKNINNDLKIELSHYINEVNVSHAEEDINPITLFELELFLYLYNNDKVIFLFDDFNAICPHYETEVLQMLKLLRDEGKRMWIMTCPYKHTKTPLVKEFQNLYKLDPLRLDEKKTYLERFFRTNLKLERLNYDQFENVRSFFKYMYKRTNIRMVSDPDRELVPVFSLALHLIYVLAVKFFRSEINKPSAATIRARVKENFEIDLDKYSPIDEVLGRTPDDEELELSGTPLHLYLAANYFKFRIEESITCLLSADEARDKWEVMLNSFTLYQHCIEADLMRILQKENADNEFVASTYRETRQEFFDKHKKLGLFVMFRENDLDKCLRPDEISELRGTIAKIRSGEDRSSLIDCVVDEVPQFAHLMFAEYFAVECLTDMMKQLTTDRDHNPLKTASLWQSLLNLLLFKAPPGVRKAFDYKLQTDNALAELAKSSLCREVVFELLLKEDKRVTEIGESSDTPLTDALEDGFTNIVKLFLSSAQLNLNRGNVDDVLSLFTRSKEKFIEFSKEYAEIIVNAIEFVGNMEFSKLEDLWKSGRLTEVPLRHASDYCSSETGSDLRRIVEASAQIPKLAESVQQLCAQGGNIKQTLTDLAQLGVKTMIADFLDKLKPPDPDLD